MSSEIELMRTKIVQFKFKQFWRCTLRFRLLLIVAGALMFMAAFAPTADATLITYFNFEDSTVGAAPDFTSDGLLSTTITTNYAANSMSSVSPGLLSNVAPGDLDPNLLALGLSRSQSNSPADFNIPLFTPAGLQNMSLSFATSSNGSGFTSATLWYSTNGGATFTNSGISNPLNLPTQTVTFAVPTAANDAALLDLRIELTGGQSAGANIQNEIDNIQVNGTIVSATVPDTGMTASLFGLSLAGLAFFRRKLC
jgi:hypothetical protein